MARATAIGLMSGTSYDGVDVALVDTDGEEIGRLGPTGYRPYSDRERDVVRRAIAVAANLTERTARPAVLVEAEELVTDMHAEAVEAFLAANGMAPSAVAVVGFHGQTVLHRPDRGLTIQLGNGAALAGRLGIPVVYDFRAGRRRRRARRADGAGISSRHAAPAQARASHRRAQSGRRRQHHLHQRRRRARRLRHRAGQRADRRLRAPAHRATAG